MQREHTEIILSQVNILGAWLQASPGKSLIQLAQQAWVSASSLHNKRKLLNCHLCTATVVHRLFHADCKTKFNFVNWYLHVTQAGEISSVLVLFSNETLYHLSECVNSQNDKYRSVENPLHDVNVSKCCIMTAASIIRHIFYRPHGFWHHLLNSAPSMRKLIPLSLYLYLFFLHEDTTVAHTLKHSSAFFKCGDLQRYINYALN